MLKPSYWSIPVSYDKSLEATDNYNYQNLSKDQLSNTVLNDYMESYKDAINTLVVNKYELNQVYKNRKTDLEFLNVGNFIPVLKFTKYIEDYKIYIEQINQNDLQNAINNTYPNYMTDPKFKVGSLHIQVFMILASNLYNTNPTDVNGVLLNMS